MWFLSRFVLHDADCKGKVNTLSLNAGLFASRHRLGVHMSILKSSLLCKVFFWGNNKMSLSRTMSNRHVFRGSGSLNKF